MKTNRVRSHWSEKKRKMRINDPFFNERTDLTLAILRSKGAIPFKRSQLNGGLHKQVAAAIVAAYEAGSSIDVTTRRSQTLHELGYSTKILDYLDNMVKQELLISQSKKADGRLYLGELLTIDLIAFIAAIKTQDSSKESLRRLKHQFFAHIEPDPTRPMSD